MTGTELFVSYAQNREDVVLWRALGHIVDGVYIDVGANHPSVDSVTRSFYDRGWSGIAIEPSPVFAAKFRAERPRDVVVEAVVTDSAEKIRTLHMINETGLSTLVDSIGQRHSETGFDVTDIEVAARRLDDVIAATRYAAGEIHFMSIDTEGAEGSVLRSLDFTRFRPWVLIVEATEPRTTSRTHESWEPLVLAAGYSYCLFDGISRFYVANERREELHPKLDHGACFFDQFVTVREIELNETMRRLKSTIHSETARNTRLEAELARTLRTLSWRLTRPLRFIRSNIHRGTEKK